MHLDAKPFPAPRLPLRHHTAVALLLLCGAALPILHAEEAGKTGGAAASAPQGEAYPRISEEAFKARLPFFDYDPSLPLEGRVVQEWDKDGTLRQKIVFRGAQGFLVPALLELPQAGARPLPLVLLLHGWSGSKANWWEDENIISGGPMREALLGAGYAVLALDAATHGERSIEIDYQHVNAFEDPNAPARHNYFTYAEIAVQTVKDYRRALDYVATRAEIDMARIGLVGYSMGGMDAFYLLSVEPRIKMAVACVPPLLSDGYGPASPIDYSWGVKDKPLLMLMGRQDEMYDAAKVEASYHQYIEGPNTKLLWYERDHKLTDLYVPDALAWVKQHLPVE
ncbi:MAG: alpha/beta fold hydrolase [Candidatus Hydrogenedentes bacterium]|nr:alpha/beta fold hydrolase [Candidatus Hydrogenedentota bacterium]